MAACLFSFCSGIAVFSACGAPQEELPQYRIEPIVVTANRTPTLFSLLSRSVAIIDSTDIGESLSPAVQDLVERAGGIDVRQRGPMGVQGDISIRGGTAGQTLILIDGVKVTDPQTNHHNANLPVTVRDIERIEILKGPDARMYGPNAFGGVINIITRKPRGKRVRIGNSGGEHGLYEAFLSVDFPAAGASHLLTVSRRRWDGYRPNTDFDIWSIFFKSDRSVERGDLFFTAGHIDNAFGANSFYVDPSKSQSEWERVRTTLVTAGGTVNLDRTTLTPRLSIRRNEDRYLFRREDPAYYENRHTTWNITGEQALSLRSFLGVTSFGAELGWERIASTRLDTLSRWKGGISVEQRLEPSNHWRIVLGGFAYRYSRRDWQLWPGIDIGYTPVPAITLFGSINRSFRIPTFTELYYISPSNEGDPELGPEEGWAYEIGSNWRTGPLRGTLSLFIRRGEEIIDWVRPAGSQNLWRATMIGDVDLRGVETDLSLDINRFSLTRLRAGYSWLDSDREIAGQESAYALAFLAHSAHLSLRQRLPSGIGVLWHCRYERRNARDGHLLVDSSLRWSAGAVDLYLGISNMFDTAYEDLRSLPLPGRLIRAGVQLNLP